MRAERAAERVPVGVVLYQPDLHLLDELLGNLDRGGRSIYLFANGALTAEVEDRLSRLSCAEVFRSSENIGLGAALNHLVASASSAGHSHILLLDQDTTPPPDLPERLLARFAARMPKRLAIVAPLLVPPAGSAYRAIRYAWRSAERGEVFFAPTSGSLLSIEAFNEVGPFRSDYFIGGIDVEWGFRAGSLGYGSIVATDIRLEHRWGLEDERSRTPQVLRQSETRLFYYFRNACDSLRQDFIPLGWRLKYAARLCAQALVLLHARRYAKGTRVLLRSAIADGLSGRLGSAESRRWK